MLQRFDVAINNVACNRNELVEMVTGKFHEAFVQKWGGKYTYRRGQITGRQSFRNE